MVGDFGLKGFGMFRGLGLELWELRFRRSGAGWGNEGFGKFGALWFRSQGLV